MKFRLAKLQVAFCLSAFLLSSELAFAADSNQDKWQKIYTTGKESLRLAEYGKAERQLNQAVILSASFGEGDKRFADSLGSYGEYLTIRGRFGEAEPILEEELHARELCTDTTSGAILPSMSSLVGFYINNGTQAKAAPLAERLLAFVEGKMSEHRQAQSGPLTLKKGQPLTGWAGSAAKSMVTPVIEWAIALDAIGNDFKSIKDYDMAERLFDAALEVKETVLGKDHLSLANSFDNLAAVYQERQDEARAEQYYRYALETTIRVLGEKEPLAYAQVYNRLDKLAKCLVKQQKYEEAENLYLSAIKRDFWKDDPSKAGVEARLYYSLGNVYVLEKKFELAEPVLKKALEVAEGYFGSESISLVPFFQRNADNMYYLKKDDLRVQYKSRANAITDTTM